MSHVLLDSLLVVAQIVHPGAGIETYLVGRFVFNTAFFTILPEVIIEVIGADRHLSLALKDIFLITVYPEQLIQDMGSKIAYIQRSFS